MLHNALEFLLRHGYIVLLVWVFAEQIGLPVPSIPLLLAAGALAGSRQLNAIACVLLSVGAAVLADSTWYRLGRFKGMKVLQLICKVSLEPDSCVRRAEGAFAKRGARSLLVAKFVPGLGTVAAPLAGVFLMRWERFLLFDICGAALWAGAYLGLGFIFSGEIERVGEYVLRFGGGVVTLVVGVLAAYIAYKFVSRQRFLRELRIARITVDELKKKIDAREELVIVDLRHSMDFESDPDTIPGALHLNAADLEKEDGRVPRDREIILYCT
jgi:membrane protein DedA with SNARE-associated domain